MERVVTITRDNFEIVTDTVGFDLPFLAYLLSDKKGMTNLPLFHVDQNRNFRDVRCVNELAKGVAIGAGIKGNMWDTLAPNVDPQNHNHLPDSDAMVIAQRMAALVRWCEKQNKV